MTADQLNAVFGALADPTRRAILARLADGDANVAELTAPFKVSQPAISKHLKVLEAAGLVSRTRRATTRLSHLEADPLRSATEWLVGYREYWEESHQRLDALLAALQVDRSRRGTDDVRRRRSMPRPACPSSTSPASSTPRATSSTRPTRIRS